MFPFDDVIMTISISGMEECQESVDHDSGKQNMDHTDKALKRLNIDHSNDKYEK